jgi:hypothetical protein
LIDPVTGKLIDKNEVSRLDGDLDFSSDDKDSDFAPEDNEKFKQRFPEA